ncbi:hypothetical protein LCGC14_2101260, partial [marine sediment metagenome]
EQLTAEKIVTKYKKGFPIRSYMKKRDRNEALDMFVYAIAALHILAIRIYPTCTVSQMLELLAERMAPAGTGSHSPPIPSESKTRGQGESRIKRHSAVEV